MESEVKLEDWQPIDNAPKDGTTVDLWVCDRQPFYKAHRIPDVRWDKNSNSWRNNVSSPFGANDATHFMYSPRPPLEYLLDKIINKF